VAAAAVAAVGLVSIVLPAEYGWDPIGTGRALGLTALAGVETSPPPAAGLPKADGQPAHREVNLQSDTFEIELRPFDSVEYKYRLEAGDGLVYTWSATGMVTFDFHGEPDGVSSKNAESYVKGEASTYQGTFTAAKPGIHGWYWKNNSAGRATVTLRTSGFYSKAIKFYDGDRIERVFGSQGR
jgi:hypothetical protein